VRQSTLRIAGLSAIRTLPDLSTRVEGSLLPGLCNTDVFFTCIRWTMPDPYESLYGRDVTHQYSVEIVSALLVSMNPGCSHAEQVRRERCSE
jgi:hypothetical protein